MTQSPPDAPSSARIYNYFLGGTDHYLIDREAGDTFLAHRPTVKAAARANRGFMLRAVKALADAGIDQFLDIGAGLPLAPNVHDVARTVHADARVVYVDADPTVVSYCKALTRQPGISSLLGDVRDPAEILLHAAGFLDLSRPVGLIAVAVMHFVPEDEAGAYLAQLRDALAPGSYLALSHACNAFVPPKDVKAAQALYQQTSDPVRIRSLEEITALFDGWSVLDPGLVPVAEWRPVENDLFPDHAVENVAGVGILTRR
ncbi:SAM-dependent methyltransferase [Nonomuraea sp. NN258]|uniref:SAM-dependent methyltransferase n=1 Tax=Nonomuraea antri TaxID=2730852 RepID=UPI00156A2075|nr:SAM-dependent methyltransferase [Nonomuraea antri]NRQ31340.1 SAM-dependent methyltransferase [Nonomuraea antri]